MCGPGGRYNTMPDERVDIPDYLDMVRIYRLAILKAFVRRRGRQTISRPGNIGLARAVFSLYTPRITSGVERT